MKFMYMKSSIQYISSLVKQIRVVILCFVLSYGFSLFGQADTEIEMRDFIRESQQWSRPENKVTMVWWIPTSHWRISMANKPSISNDVKDYIENTFKDVVFVCVLDGTFDSESNFKYTDEATMRKNISIIDEKKNVYFPLTEDQMSLDIKEVSANLKPALASSLGEMGVNLSFYYFKIKDSNGKNIYNEKEKGELIINFFNKEYKWILPMISLLPPKYCPIDNDKMKGNWKYCPFHGIKLDN